MYTCWVGEREGGREGRREWGKWEGEKRVRGKRGGGEGREGEREGGRRDKR